MQWNIRRRKTRSERLRETSCCDELRYGDVAMADLAIVSLKHPASSSHTFMSEFLPFRHIS